MAHYFPYDVKLRILAHSRSFLANHKARNAIFGAENLLILDIAEILILQFVLISVFINQALSLKIKKKRGQSFADKKWYKLGQINFSGEIQTLKRFKFFM